jgi:hypothetical protein
MMRRSLFTLHGKVANNNATPQAVSGLEGTEQRPLLEFLTKMYTEIWRRQCEDVGWNAV